MPSRLAAKPCPLSACLPGQHVFGGGELRSHPVEELLPVLVGQVCNPSPLSRRTRSAPAGRRSEDLRVWPRRSRRRSRARTRAAKRRVSSRRSSCRAENRESCGQTGASSFSTAVIDGMAGPSGTFHITTSAPCGRRTRAISVKAASVSNQWKAWATKTASTESTASGICSALPSIASLSGQPTASRRRILASGSTATTRANLETRGRVSLPVPAASSSTVADDGRPAISTTWSGYPGRPRS